MLNHLLIHGAHKVADEQVLLAQAKLQGIHILVSLPTTPSEMSAGRLLVSNDLVDPDPGCLCRHPGSQLSPIAPVRAVQQRTVLHVWRCCACNKRVAAAHLEALDGDIAPGDRGHFKGLQQAGVDLAPLLPNGCHPACRTLAAFKHGQEAESELQHHPVLVKTGLLHSPQPAHALKSTKSAQTPACTAKGLVFLTTWCT